MSGPRAVLADDEPLLLDALADALARAWPQLDVVAACADGDAALDAIRRERPQVAFLDIRMPGRSGLQVASEAAADGVDAPLWVFVTAHDAHALDAFEREAVDYLLKPLDAARLARTVERLRARLEERAAAPPGAPPAADKYLRVLTRDGEALIRMPLKEVLDRLPADEFWQIRRGTVVRVREVARTTRTLSGRLVVHLRSRPERFEVSRPFAHLFRAD